MNRDSDPLLRAFGDLPSPTLDERSRARILRRAEAELTSEGRFQSTVLRWSRVALPMAMLACEGVYLVRTMELMARVFN